MGAWDSTPFGNDSAADFSGDFDDAAESERVVLVREALTGLAEADYVDMDDACVAIAAAAIVASQRPGGPAVDEAYGPDFLVAGGTIAFPDDITALAAQALDRIVGEESEWVELWDESDLLEEAKSGLNPIRAALTP